MSDPWILGSTPTSLKQAHYLDGLRFCFEAVELAANRLDATLLEISRNVLANSPNATPAIAGALADAWLIVDAVFRARKLISGLPGLKQAKFPARKLFLDKTKPVEELRNTIQHLDTDLSTLSHADDRAWGTLEWFCAPTEHSGKAYAFLLVPGFGGGGTFGICPYTQAPLDATIAAIVLTCRKRTVQITEMVEAIGTLDAALRDAFGTPYTGPPIDGRDMLFYAELKVDTVKGRRPLSRRSNSSTTK